jgi:galactokinase/mevalonate kinase-like predicted kinase
MLYYTGITRVARNILSEIVKSIFLNKAETMSIINDISLNAKFIADALQKNDSVSFDEGIRRSWQLNRELDKGTCPPAIKGIIEQIAPFDPACKLLGAGGGGYMLILAKDTVSAAAIRESLTTNAPNPRARFVDLEISHTGIQITRS